MIRQSRSWAHIQTKLEFEKTHHPNIHSSTIHNSQDMKARMEPLTDEWIKKMWYIYIVGYQP